MNIIAGMKPRENPKSAPTPAEEIIAAVFFASFQKNFAAARRNAAAHLGQYRHAFNPRA